MAFQEVTNIGWFSRIGSSIKGILFGFLLLAGGALMLVLNERNAVKDIKANKEIAREVISIESDAVAAGNEGKLVHVTGKADTGDVLKMKKFGIEEVALNLTWTAEIYQWVEDESTRTEKKPGGGERRVTTYSYEKKWVSSAVDSSKFKESGHDNNSQQKFKSGRQLATNVTLDAFELPASLVSQISKPEDLPLEDVPAEVASQGKVSGSTFHTGDLSNPQIGDEKVVFKVTRPLDVSVMAKQVGDSFAEYETKSGKAKLLISNGTLTAAQMVEAEEQKAAFLRWALRGGGALLMFIGFWLILAPLSVLADVIPFLGSLVGMVTGLIALLLSAAFSLVIIALSWIFFRPLLGIPLLLAAVACFVLVIKKMKSGSRATPSPPPIPVG